MADLKQALFNVLLDEDRNYKTDGFKLHTVAGDSGGQTIAGIARNYHPEWIGWKLVDSGDRKSDALMTAIIAFYDVKFWSKIKGSELISQCLAEELFDFGMNSSPANSIKYAQVCVNCTPDGDLGPKTLEALNACNTDGFKNKFALMRIGHRIRRCKQNATQKKFLVGWITRDLRSLSSDLNVLKYFGI